MIDEVVKSITNKIDTFLIAKIIKVDTKGFVDVQPLSESKGISLPPILHVPMGQVGNSAIKVRLQFEVGNVIPLLIASRDISNYISEEDTKPNTNKRHNLTNAIALPILISTDVNNVEIPSQNIVIDGNAEWNGDIIINGNVNINGNLVVSGTSTANDHISSGISGKSHVHSGITLGGDDTKVPK